ncbi:MAG: SIS domain-containing protein [Kiritimatiellaeota bacterium]|nr:SIS domain-containing protein [Kiritimatiellota bacterium]
MTDKQVISDYTQKLAAAAQDVNAEALEKALAALREVCARRGRIFVMGNGGSAAIADHLAADFEKNAFPNGPRPRILSLSSQAAKILAYGNDIAFEGVFSEQLKGQGDKDDVAVVVSSSGNSPNIVRAVEMAKSLGMTVIGLSGFSGGKLKEMSDISLHFECPMYEMTEDLHSMVCHLFVVGVREGGA